VCATQVLPMRVGPFAFRYQGNGATPSQYIDTTRKAIFLFNIKAKGPEGHLHCSAQYKFKQQYTVADKSYLLSGNNRKNV